MLKLWRRASLRTQLVAIISALLAVSLITLGSTTYVLLRGFLIDQMDYQLGIVQSTIFGAGFSPNDERSRPPSTYFRMLDKDGKVISESVPGKIKPVLPSPTLPEALAMNAKPFDAPSENNSTNWRAVIVAPVVISSPVSENQSSTATCYIEIAMTYDNLDASVDRLSMVLIAVGLSAVALGTLIAFWAVSRSFRPLVRVERTAAAIAAGDLSQRVKIQNPATEVGRLSVSLNTMLEHIEAAFDARKASEGRMRRFVADASHELRTPLVTIRGFSELYRHGALQGDEDVATAMGRIESEAKRMGALVEDLLVLARIDEQRPLQKKPIDLLILGNDAAVDARASSSKRKVTVIGLDSGPAANAPVVGDEARLRQVIANLMANALRYTPEVSPLEVAIGVSIQPGNRYSTLQIRDHGPSIDEATAPRIFERFYRAESSRNRDTGGSGLGLAIVAAIVSSHQGQVRFSKTEGGGATMTVQLPYAEPLPGE
ncbi:phosphate regulon sensor protein [Renibacterium salmoninarum ATCC 33209]|uniref:histidine kinase n=1 Tax=Renibacterium salmoninarum (strain ATCC 33209 / DSM 20767 / JCM 11484 / NBRC 15589 / NCIMB 2235) TaxID=288705 RepID=A9WMA3_RENSM|nr:HAMP domain-containing sensor histidine kinase [Renibacterium salmoninarum]ABY22235.1 phosphate regulon sensor protein [Renibacterium salmoninarum ATCC 33209]